MFRAEVHVTFKTGVLDPQGETVARSLRSLGFEGVSQVQIGRFIQVDLEGQDSEQVAAAVELMCQELLANPVLEQYRIEVLPLAAGDVSGPEGAEG